MSLTAAVEGDTDIPVVRKLALDAGIELLEVIDSEGKAALDASLRGYNGAARGSPWLVLRDQDMDPRCPGQIVTDLIGRPAIWMSLRLAVREVESWLMADRDEIADFLVVDPAEVPKIRTLRMIRNEPW